MKASAGEKGFQRQLRRIVALLFALAGLAERAAGRSGPVRLLVFWLLWRGEAVVRDYVFSLTGRDPCPPLPAGLADDDSEALHLAARLRALAAALAAFVETVVAARLTEIGRLAPRLIGALSAFAGIAHAAERLDSS